MLFELASCVLEKVGCPHPGPCYILHQMPLPSEQRGRVQPFPGWSGATLVSLVHEIRSPQPARAGVPESPLLNHSGGGDNAHGGNSTLDPQGPGAGPDPRSGVAEPGSQAPCSGLEGSLFVPARRCAWPVVPDSDFRKTDRAPTLSL